MAQYPIPQFIEEEGKIIFFLTYRQFFLLVGGGFVCVLLYFAIAPFSFYLFVIAAMFVGGITAMIAFLKVNNESIVTIFMNFIGFSMKSKTYTWKKNESAHPITSASSIKRADASPPQKMRPNTLSDIKKLVETKKQ